MKEGVHPRGVTTAASSRPNARPETSKTYTKIVFDQRGTFAANDAAEAWLAERGFSVGRMQRGARRGILKGDYDIQKWRNLRPADIAALDGWISGDGRYGPVMITLSDGALGRQDGTPDDASGMNPS